MMPPVQPTSLFLAFYFLTMVSTASAECAWVLWCCDTATTSVTLRAGLYGTTSGRSTSELHV